MQRSSDTAALLAEMWACLLWLLVNHGAALMAALSAGWAEQQAVECADLQMQLAEAQWQSRHREAELR